MEAGAIKKTIVLKGIGVSPGIVNGRAYLFNCQDLPTTYYKLDTKVLVSKEVKRFRNALKASSRELLEIKERISRKEGIEPLFVDIHIMILKDKMFIRETVENIRERRVNAEWALKLTLVKYRDIFKKMGDEYIRERINDVEYVSERILRNLSGKSCEKISDIEEEVIIIARDLSPADTIQINTEKVLGFATDIGGKTSHTAIVARSMEIPAVVGLERVARQIQTGDHVIIDGTAGVVIINPDPEILKRYEDKKKHYQIMAKNLIRNAALPAVTRDNYRVEIGANIEFVEEIPSAVSHGTDGVGLYRTEFIYVNKEQLPTEEEHFLNYKRVVSDPGLKWATIRTFDLGGDKFVSDPRLAEEMNPAMGLRAIRFCLREVDLFKVQLRAILRASIHGKTKILFPMISGVAEIREAKKILCDVKEELRNEGVPIDENIEIGIMIEVPSAVMMADKLAEEVDFFSIGTNDLIQYSLAIDRVNERVTYLYEPLHPAILRLIKHVVDAGHDAGIKIAMCGEMAGEPFYSLILLGLGIDELSMTPLAIPRMKNIIRAATLKESKNLLDTVMSFSMVKEIEEYVRSYMVKRFPEDFPINNASYR
ncbi:MAG TPA: phosphoenolpyruvate--protein phosphotransferase [Deltaproteobacteria bacterium]|nr:phosphoenolpyruvate--protein phosphotransferase [Deltaproteobacteria bacterium]